MDTEIDLTTASRDVLIAIIVQQQAVIAELQVMMVRLERRIAELEGQANRAARPECPATSPVRAGSRQRSSSPASSDATASPAGA